MTYTTQAMPSILQSVCSVFNVWNTMARWNTFVIPPCDKLSDIMLHTLFRVSSAKSRSRRQSFAERPHALLHLARLLFFHQFVIHVVRGWRGATCVSLETSLVCLLPFWTSLWLHCHPFQQHSYFAAHVWLGVQLHYTFPHFILRATGKRRFS